MGYQAVPISAGTFLAAARLDEWKAGKHFLSLMRALEGPLPELQSVLRVSVQFVKELWLLPTFEQARLTLLFPLLDAIIVRRSAQVVLIRLQRALNNEFRLLPLHRQEIGELIARWMEQRAPRL